MNTIIAAILFLAPISSLLNAGPIPNDISQEEKPATIKVLITAQENPLFLESKGSYRMYNPLTGMPITEGMSRKKGWLKTCEQGLVWGEVIPGMFQIRLVPSHVESTFLVDGIEYKGCLDIHYLDGKLHVINEIDVERYLKATITAENFAEFDEEVLDAIAIVARTNAYYVTNKYTPYWHVDKSEIGYQGYGITLQNIAMERAIDNTRHMVLTYQGAPFPATWTKNSGGRTANFATIYRKNVSVPQGVTSAFAAHDREKSAWSFSISKQDLAKALGAIQVTAFDLYQDSESKKVYGVKVKEGDKTLQFDFKKLQTALGKRLKSNDFNVQMVGDKILFKGFGEGSGVGLCLYGASAMADKGAKAPKILNTFFPETKLEKIRALTE